LPTIIIKIVIAIEKGLTYLIPQVLKKIFQVYVTKLPSNPVLLAAAYVIEWLISYNNILYTLMYFIHYNIVTLILNEFKILCSV